LKESVQTNGDMVDDDHIVPYRHKCESKQDEQLLMDTLGLLAYENPQNSPLSYLLNESNKHELSTAVNQLILESLKQDAYSALEKIHMQLDICRQVMSSESIGCGDTLQFNV
jgi:hypothetical protein